MKKVALFICLCLAGIQSYAQKQIVPEEIYGVAVLQEDSTTTLLGVEKVLYKQKSSPLSIVPVVGLAAKHKSMMIVKGNTSKTVVKPGNLQLVARVRNNSKKGRDVIFVTKLDVDKKSRSFKVLEGSLFQGNIVDSHYNNTEWKCEKYGENAYIVSFDNIEPGEYWVGIWADETDEAHRSNLLVSTFSVKE